MVRAVNFCVENHLQVSPVISARTGRGIRLVPAIHGYTGAVALLWHAGRTHTSIFEQAADENSVIGPLRLSQDHKDWQPLLVLQILPGH